MNRMPSESMSSKGHTFWLKAIAPEQNPASARASGCGGVGWGGVGWGGVGWGGWEAGLSNRSLSNGLPIMCDERMAFSSPWVYMPALAPPLSALWAPGGPQMLRKCVQPACAFCR